MATLLPKVTGDPAQDSWQFETTNVVNLSQERLDALLAAMRAFPDDPATNDLRDAIIAALNITV